jgi:hypothetical protein
MNRAWYRIVWILEVVSILLLALTLSLPILDYSRSEILDWYRHPSAETLRAVRDSQRREFMWRLTLSAPFAATAILLIFPLRKLRSKLKK